MLLTRPIYHNTAVVPIIIALQMLEFNVPGGKLNRGMAVLDVLRAIKGSEVCFEQITAYTRHAA